MRPRTLVLSVVAAAAVAVWLNPWPLLDSLGPCENSGVRVVPAPAGGSRALVFTRDCGATTGWATMVTVRGRLGGSRPFGPGNAFHATWDRGRADLPRSVGGPPVRVEWLGPDRLRVTVDDRARSWRALAPVHGVTVEDRAARLAADATPGVP